MAPVAVAPPPLRFSFQPLAGHKVRRGCGAQSPARKKRRIGCGAQSPARKKARIDKGVLTRLPKGGPRPSGPRAIVQRESGADHDTQPVSPAARVGPIPTLTVGRSWGTRPRHKASTCPYGTNVAEALNLINKSLRAFCVRILRRPAAIARCSDPRAPRTLRPRYCIAKRPQHPLSMLIMIMCSSVIHMLIHHLLLLQHVFQIPRMEI